MAVGGLDEVVLRLGANGSRQDPLGVVVVGAHLRPRLPCTVVGVAAVTWHTYIGKHFKFKSLTIYFTREELRDV